MDLIVIVIGVGALAILIIPFFWAYFSAQRKNKAIVDNFLKISGLSREDVGEMDILHNAVIAIDNKGQILYHLKTQDSNNYLVKIDLKNIESSEIVTTSQTIKTKSETYTIVERLELIINQKDRNKKIIPLVFYDQSETLQLNGEMPIIEKWSKIIKKNRSQH